MVVRYDSLSLCLVSLSHILTNPFKLETDRLPVQMNLGVHISPKYS